MHELPVTHSILNVVLKHAQTNHVKKIHSITLRIGKLSDLEDEWLQRYFDYISKGSVAEGAKLKIERTPVVVKCDSCGNTFEVDVKKPEEISCPACSEKGFSLVSGREYHIVSMEAQ